MSDDFSLTGREDSPVIVGLGASAGGLEALQAFFDTLPEDNTLAFVIVQHLDPDHDSLMKELLERRTRLPVRVAEDGVRVEPGHIYIIAPGQSLTVERDHLRTRDFALPRGRRRPIDEFFVSLARNSREKAVGVVLSGTGSDGALGARAIKEYGGLVFAQSLSEAKYDGMPRSVIETGIADFTLSASEIFPVLNDYFDCRGTIPADELSDRQFIDRAMRHVRYRTGHDFTGYKPGTLLRRIAIRMALLGITKPGDYVKVLISDHDEGARLFRDVLINVTNFFRDEQVFDELRDAILPDLIRQKAPGDELRIWVPGCSTGQEAYSIAMLASEAAEALEIPCRVQVFATDISEDALTVARRGHYPNAAGEEIPTAYLHKYFKWHSDGYTVTDRLRAMVRFSAQSLTRDPPFGQIDLVSCRNVLIYFDRDLQERAIKVFQFSLREGGILLLGTSETPAGIGQYFEEVSRQNRFHRRRPGRPARLEVSPLRASSDPPDPQPAGDGADRGGSAIAEALVDMLAPAYLNVSDGGDLLYASDPATQYLALSAGRPQLDVLKLIRPELAKPLRRLLNKPQDSAGATTEFSGELDGAARRITLMRHRIGGAQDLVLFVDHGSDLGRPLPDLPDGLEERTAHYIKELEQELEEARQKIRSTIEELETSNEELKSSNEEMMSMNEELQSANEELTTTNDELNIKIGEVREANLDLANFIEATKVATIFLDADLSLRSYTPEARKLFRFHESDIGRRIDDLGSDLDTAQLIEDCRETMSSGEMRETEYSTRAGAAHRARLVPYRGEDDHSMGVVVSLFDVTELRNLARDAESARQIAARRQEEIEELYDTTPQAMALLSEDLIYQRANRKMANLAGTEVDKILGKTLGDLSDGLGDRMTTIAREVLSTGTRFENHQLRGRLATDPDTPRVWETDWYPIYHDGKVTGVGLNVRDLTEQVEMQFELRRVMQELQHRVKNMLANVLALVSRAGRDVTTDRAIFDALSQRIHALSKTHKLLTQSNWTSARLKEVLWPELVDVYGEERVELRGPDITVNSRAALSLGMAIHELATNAAKYGSFSNDDGRVSLSWVRQDDGASDDFIFTWTEIGGPGVTSGETSGFGSQLIKSTIEGSLDGKVSFFWEPSGLKCVFHVPTHALIEIPNESVFDSVDP